MITLKELLAKGEKANRKLTPPDKRYIPKENCYGKTVDYKMAPGKKVCAFNPGGGGKG